MGRDAATNVAIAEARDGLNTACTLADYEEIGFTGSTAAEISDSVIQIYQGCYRHDEQPLSPWLATGVRRPQNMPEIR